VRRAACAKAILTAIGIDNVEDVGAVPHEFIDAGDRVIVPVRMHGRLRDSGEPVAYSSCKCGWAATGRPSGW